MFVKVSDITDPLKVTALSKRLGIPQLHGNNEKTEDVHDTINNSCPETVDIILAETFLKNLFKMKTVT